MKRLVRQVFLASAVITIIGGTLLLYLCVVMEEEEPSLVASSVIYRIYFILLVDVCKVLAGIEELCGVQTRWGTMARLPEFGG